LKGCCSDGLLFQLITVTVGLQLVVKVKDKPLELVDLSVTKIQILINDE